MMPYIGTAQLLLNEGKLAQGHRGEYVVVGKTKQDELGLPWANGEEGVASERPESILMGSK
jgi:hypothetical protein